MWINPSLYSNGTWWKGPLGRHSPADGGPASSMAWSCLCLIRWLTGQDNVTAISRYCYSLNLAIICLWWEGLCFLISLPRDNMILPPHHCVTTTPYHHDMTPPYNHDITTTPLYHHHTIPPWYHHHTMRLLTHHTYTTITLQHNHITNYTTLLWDLDIALSSIPVLATSTHSKPHTYEPPPLSLFLSTFIPGTYLIYNTPPPPS